LGMLIYQGAIAFELWTKEKMPIHVIEKLFD
ncbi:shikimate dehydrogenase, partial [Enterococcus faecium]